MAKIIRILFPVLWLTLLAAHAEADWSVQIFTGAAHNFRTNLTIEQPGEPTLKFPAHYVTHTFRSAPYYCVRIGRWKNENAWELELTHDKLYLTNLQPDVPQFNISNGYSFLLVNHAWEYRSFILRAGGGALIAYPITTIRGIHTSGGYRLSGFAFQGAAEKRFFIGQNFFLSAEGKFTVARASVDLNGSANAKVPNVGLHGLLGFGFKL